MKLTMLLLLVLFYDDDDYQSFQVFGYVCIYSFQKLFFVLTNNKDDILGF